MTETGMRLLALMAEDEDACAVFLDLAMRREAVSTNRLATEWDCDRKRLRDITRKLEVATLVRRKGMMVEAREQARETLTAAFRRSPEQRKIARRVVAVVKGMWARTWLENPDRADESPLTLRHCCDTLGVEVEFVQMIVRPLYGVASTRPRQRDQSTGIRPWRLPKAGNMVLAALKEGRQWRYAVDIAKALGLSDSTVRRVLVLLRDAGLARKCRGGGWSAVRQGQVVVERAEA